VTKPGTRAVTFLEYAHKFLSVFAGSFGDLQACSRPAASSTASAAGTLLAPWKIGDAAEWLCG
jgi:hypothetical protein